jgi:hypothetical protein
MKKILISCSAEMRRGNVEAFPRRKQVAVELKVVKNDRR